MDGALLLLMDAATRWFVQAMEIISSVCDHIEVLFDVALDNGRRTEQR